MLYIIPPPPTDICELHILALNGKNGYNISSSTPSQLIVTDS